MIPYWFTSVLTGGDIEGFLTSLSSIPKYSWVSRELESLKVEVVEKFKVRGRYSRMITLVKPDGRVIPVPRSSVVVPLTGRQLALSVMRLLVAPQIKEFRKSFREKVREGKRQSNFKCPLSGRDLRYCETHVHHAGKPFIQIAEEWLLLNGFEGFSEIEILGKGRNLRFRYKELAESWQEYHKTNSYLQLVDGSSNISEGAGDYKSVTSN